MDQMQRQKNKETNRVGDGAACGNSNRAVRHGSQPNEAGGLPELGRGTEDALSHGSIRIVGVGEVVIWNERGKGHASPANGAVSRLVLRPKILPTVLSLLHLLTKA